MTFYSFHLKEFDWNTSSFETAVNFHPVGKKNLPRHPCQVMISGLDRYHTFLKQTH